MQRKTSDLIRLHLRPFAPSLFTSTAIRAKALTIHALPENSAPMSIPSEFHNVTAVTKANVYFDGRVVSHTLRFADGSKKTLGLIYPGRYHFGTDKAERMELVAGSCTVQIDGALTALTFHAGTHFDVPAKSGFDIEVTSGIAEYICSFID